MGTTVFRGQAFVTPHHGRLLNGRFVIRRRPRSGDVRFPAATAILARGARELARIEFQEGQAQLEYSAMPAIAKQMPSGLDAGEYTLRIDGGGESTAFVVEEPAEATRIMEDADSLAELLGDRHHPLCVQVAVESLLDQRDDDDKPLAYWSDALDLLESVPEANDSEYLRFLRDQVGRRLRREKQNSPAVTLAHTGIDVIDRARRHIAVGEWRDAWDLLHHDLPPNSRAQALGKLHRAIIMGQSGRGATDRAGRLFREALSELRWESDSDRFLAHVNAGNYFLGDAQDHLYNHAFQMAVGNRLPLLAALRSWSEANASYGQAEKLAATSHTGSRAALRVNQARLQLLLADVIRTLDVPNAAGRREFERGEAAAEELARESARWVLELAPQDVEPMARASAAEILAQLAHRRGAEQDCRELAMQAIALYLDAGSLGGVEGAYRLLGLHFRQSTSGRLAPAEAAESAAAAPAKEALRCFLISARLAEILRARIPSDRFGLAHAGFFARRAYVNEQIIDLLVSQERPAEALHYAELAKARSLQDLLASRQGGSFVARENDVEGAEGAETTRSLEECLDEWPGDVAAIEYFLGSEKAWRFVVDTKGEVHASELLPEGRSSRELVAEVGRFLKGLDRAKSDMRGRLESHRPFDQQWQYQLRDFRQILAPDEVLSQLRPAKTVIVVPHHILHYFPFAALVIECDESRRDLGQMVQPRFLVDEGFNFVHAPSLGVWDLLRQRAMKPISSVSAVGIVDFPAAEPLPGVAADLENLNSVFGEQVGTVLFADQASEGNARRLLQRPGMVLFATHGANQSLQPLLSYLLCHRDKVHDGRLTAAEIYQHEVAAQLVILSACYSGLADQSPLPGDDLFGIQRAFLNAGAATIVAGMWQIDDKSGPPLMRGVFEQLARGRTAPAALADAQRQFLQERRVPGSLGEIHLHPFFWAVFAVAGDDRTHCEVRRRPDAGRNATSTTALEETAAPP